MKYAWKYLDILGMDVKLLTNLAFDLCDEKEHELTSLLKLYDLYDLTWDIVDCKN